MFVLFLSQGLCIKEAENTAVLLSEATTQIHAHMYFYCIMYGAISHDFVNAKTAHTLHIYTHHTHKHTTQYTHDTPNT